METIIKKMPVLRYVPKEENVTIYKTADGTEFLSLDDALWHEIELKYEEDTPIVDNGDTISIGYTWYKARDRKELEYLIIRLSRKYTTRNVKSLKVGEWFSVVYDIDSDGPDTVSFVPLSEVKEDIKRLIKSLNDKDKEIALKESNKDI